MHPSLLLICIMLVCRSLAADETARPAVLENDEETIVLPHPIDDPIEPVNRFLWEVNEGVMIGVVQPSAKVYRLVVPKDLRKGIRNAGRNLGYPRRAINNLLQERWSGARDETFRFFCNTVFGVGGLFDVGTRWGIAAHEADFGQTFGVWGWRPKIYIMLPVAGPSNERDALGAVLDSFANPLTYFSPYNYINQGITYNNLTDTVDEYVRLARADYDPYYVLRYAWTIRREARDVDLTLEGEQDAASLETLRAVLFTFKDPEFPEMGETASVEIPATGEKLPYTYWLQRKQAPLAYVIPGLGSHRLSGGALALAELLHQEGFAVVTVSSAYNHEFIQRGLSAPMPGFTPSDARDMRYALGAIDRALRSKFPGRFGARALIGYSMGGFHTLQIAAAESSGSPDSLSFERYVAIDAPVRLDYGIARLDSFFRAALDWPAAERIRRIEQTFLKVAGLTLQSNVITAETPLPFNATESKFLIGLAFRLTLRDLIFLSQLATNQGVLAQPIDTWRREPVYREILQYSFAEYLEKIVGPHYRARGVDLREAAQLAKAVDLRRHAEALRANPRIRIVANANDILLGAEDLDWIRATVPEERLKVFERGGHLGNLVDPAVQRAILQTVADLKKRSL